MRLVVLTLTSLTLGCGRLDFDASRVDGTLASDATDAPEPDLSGLIARFSFEVAGAVTIDSVAGRNGSCAPGECPTLVSGHRGNGFRFDGVNDCILVPDVGQLPVTRFTLSLWVLQDFDAPMTSISKRYNGGGNTWQIESIGSQTMWFTTRNAATPDHMAAAGLVRIGQWQLATATWDGTTKALYLDGALVASGTAQPVVSDASGALIGCDDNAPISGWFTGAIDEVEIYDRALVPDEVTTLAGR